MFTERHAMCALDCYLFKCELTTPARARTATAEQLGKYLGTGEETTSVSRRPCLVVSELVGNAVQVGTECALLLDVHRDHIWISVHDNGPGRPELKRPSPKSPGGRGLMMVDAVAASWGVRPAAAGKDVWATLTYPPHLPVHLTCSVGLQTG